MICYYSRYAGLLFASGLSSGRDQIEPLNPRSPLEQSWSG
jgi:hypothetical protein